MRLISSAAGLGLIAAVLWDAFETVVLPRTVTRRLRITRLYLQATWLSWAAVARRVRADHRRERFLAVFGPLSLIGLLVIWAVGMIIGFAALHFAIGSNLQGPDGAVHFGDEVYMSGSTFFTLGLGDVRPVGGVARALTVAEAGAGFGLLAIVIAYFPVLYQSFARREVRLTLLDAWAGSPPAAAEILRRLARAGQLGMLDAFLKDWEYWCSEILESHISYPIVAFFRSQHQHQSWISALTAVLDVSALVIAGIDGVATWQAQVTFAIARHAAVDLTQVFHVRPDYAAERLDQSNLEQLRWQLEEAGLLPARTADGDRRLEELRRSYEPFVSGLGELMMSPLPGWYRDQPRPDNWQTSPKYDGGAHL